MMKTLDFLSPDLMILKYLHDFGCFMWKKTKTAPSTPTQTNILCLSASAGNIGSFSVFACPEENLGGVGREES